MIIKPKLYKIALVSIAIVLMLVSTTGAFPFCGCGCGINPGHSCNDKSSDESSNKCIVCPTCPTCPTCPACNCPTCAAPALHLDKTGVLANKTYGYPINITYTYIITNTGNVPLSDINLYDNITFPSGNPITTPTILGVGASVPVTDIYTGPFHATEDGNGLLVGNVTNKAHVTAIGNGINMISNQVIVPIKYSYPPG